MIKEYPSTGELASAFPVSLRQEALKASEAFPAVRALGEGFSVWVSGERVTIPYRLYFGSALVDVDSLIPPEREIADCRLTRHSDGVLRERHLKRIIALNHPWIPPFVIKLAGEYVVEILNVIGQSLAILDAELYRDFLAGNRTFLDLTERRIMSYWDCYYRNGKQNQYVGFTILEFFRSLLPPVQANRS